MDANAIPWRSTRVQGIDVHFYASDADSGRVVALIRMAPGRGYPRHRHRGTEEVLVLQGGYRDEFGEHTAGHGPLPRRHRRSALHPAGSGSRGRRTAVADATAGPVSP